MKSVKKTNEARHSPTYLTKNDNYDASQIIVSYSKRSGQELRQTYSPEDNLKMNAAMACKNHERFGQNPHMQYFDALSGAAPFRRIVLDFLLSRFVLAGTAEKQLMQNT